MVHGVKHLQSVKKFRYSKNVMLQYELSDRLTKELNIGETSLILGDGENKAILHKIVLN
jgi:hypothetical protein